jgi:hypothetical protein
MKDTSLAVFLLAAVWAAPAGAQTQVDLRTQGKDVDFSAAPSTKPFQTGTLLPASCSVGAAFFNANAPAGQNLFACTAANVWTLESGASGLPPVTGNANKVLSNNGTTAGWQALGGDLNGAPQAVTVTGIQGHPIGTLAPADGQVLEWSGALGLWQPAVAVALGGANFSQSFTSQTTVLIPGSVHNLGTANLIVDCYNSAAPAQMIEANSITVDPSTFNVTVTFANPQSGRCVINGTGTGLSPNTSNVFATGTTQTFQGALVATGSNRTAPVQAGTALPATCTTGDQFFNTSAAAGQNLYFCTASNTWTQMSGSGGSGAVASVFGRTGAVSAQAGDYAFSQLAGTATNAQLAAGIDAAKIGAGTVTNTIWGYLSNVSSDVQAQLNGKSPVNPTTGGDLSGTLGSATVTGIQTRPVSASAPTNGQALVWNATANAWQPSTVASGASMGSQLGDFAATRSSSTVLTIGANCSSTTPCNARFGNTVYSFTQSCTATLSAGTGAAYVYVSGGGTLTIGHNLTVAASAGCLAQSSVTGFPSNAIPLYYWTATSGTWDPTGGRDYRGWLSLKNISAGTGVATVESSGQTVVEVDASVVPTYLTSAAALTFPLIANGACATDQTFTLLGALAGNSVAPAWPSAFGPGLLGLMFVSAADTITVRICNLSGTAAGPINATFGATIVRSF